MVSDALAASSRRTATKLSLGASEYMHRKHRLRIYHLLLLCGWTIVITMFLLLNLKVRNHSGLMWLTFGVIWILGVIGVRIEYAGFKRLTKECKMAQDQLQRVNSVLESQAMTDPLTGIYNRRKFLELLQLEIHESKRYKVPLVLIFFDIDHFKAINDNYGHEAGDEILQGLTAFVRNAIRQADIFARFGGEEFLILAHNDAAGGGCDLAEKIRRGVNQQNFKWVGRLTCSFGVAECLPDDTADSIIKRADDAMYLAKKKGGNLVENSCNC